MTIAQMVYDNEIHFGYSHEEVHEKVPLFLPNLVPRSTPRRVCAGVGAMRLLHAPRIPPSIVN